MSRLAKKPIVLAEKTEVSISGNKVLAKGPAGEISREFRPLIEIKIESGAVVIIPKSESRETKALLGTYAAHIKNMIKGVKESFSKKLIIEGIGYKAEVKGQEIILNLGFSHQVKIAIPQGLKVTSEKGTVVISGVSKDLVGSFAAKIRDLKKPEPYKGKGIRYEGEIIKRKQGKKAV